jgi:hypothetical protein
LDITCSPATAWDNHCLGHNLFRDRFFAYVDRSLLEQLEGDSFVINGVTCIRVETDIDYFRPFLAHGFKEVLPNLVLHRRSSPLRVFQLRWLAARKKQASGGDIPDFNPNIGLNSKR